MRYIPTRRDLAGPRGRKAVGGRIPTRRYISKYCPTRRVIPNIYTYENPPLEACFNFYTQAKYAITPLFYVGKNFHGLMEIRHLIILLMVLTLTKLLKKNMQKYR